MPRAPFSLSNFSGSNRRASVSESHHESFGGGRSSPGMSSRNTNGRESSVNEQDGDGGEAEREEVECGNVDPQRVGHEAEQRDDRNRIKLTICGKIFEPSSAMTKARDIIHCHYKGPWISFREVPNGVRYLWFIEFKQKFWWDESIQEAVYAIWKMKVSEHLRTIFNKARTSRRKPNWIMEQHWADMLHKWNVNEKFKRLSEINKKNRTCESPHGSAAYTGGSKPVIEHIKTFRSQHDNRDPTMEELLEMTYKKKNGEWSGTRPVDAIERFNELLTKAQEEGNTEIDIMKLWVEAVGGVNRGRVFGLGSKVSDIPMELLEKYAFANVHPSQPFQSEGVFNEFREDVQHKVSSLQNEVVSIKEQVSIVRNEIQNMGSQIQSYISLQGYPSQFQFPTIHPMQAQFRYNPTQVQGSLAAGGELPSSFTNLLNSNFMFGPSGTSMPPSGPFVTSNIPSNSGGGSSSMNIDSNV